MDSLPTTPEEYRAWWKANTSVPYGYCWCGCGTETRTYSQGYSNKPQVRGESRCFVQGHSARLLGPDYVEEDRGHETPCWIWRKATFGDGYGSIYRDGRTYLAHRYYYERYRGPLKSSDHLHHSCEVKPCVNPDHLEKTTNKEHHKVHHPTKRRGETHPKAKLSREDVVVIRNLYSESNLSQAKIAALYDVSPSTVASILYGRNWGWL